VCEKGSELIRPNYALEVFALLEGNINSLVLTYTPGVCVFPAHFGFTPGWVYVHVGGGAACLISPILGTCIVGVCCVLHCTGRPHSQNTMSLCWECNLLLCVPLILIDVVVFDYTPFPVSMYSTQRGCLGEKKKNEKLKVIVHILNLRAILMRIA